MQHFDSLLNKPSTVKPNALATLPQRPVLEDLDLSPSLHKIKKTTAQMNHGKASGKDGIPAEFTRLPASTPLRSSIPLCSLYVPEEDQIPADFGDALIVILYKDKKSEADCETYGDISLLSFLGKLIARFMLNRLVTISEQNPPQSQSGFRLSIPFGGHRCRRHASSNMQMLLYAFFFHLTFDTVNRKTLWTVLEQYKPHGCL